MSPEGWRKLFWEAFTDPKKRRVTVAGLSVVALSILMRRSSVLAAAASSVASKTPKPVVTASKPPKKMPFSEFLQLIEKGELEKVFMGSSVIEFFLKKSGEKYFTNPILVHPGLLEMLHMKGIPFDELVVSASATSQGLITPRGMFTAAIVSIYLGICAAAVSMIYNQTNGGDVGTLNSSNPGSSSGPAIKKTTFDDVAGINTSKEVVQEIADILKNPERYLRVGARLPTGVLLVGEPGTGKTMLAKALANDCGLPFFYCSGSDFVEIYAGRGASRVRNLFAKAKKSAPCVIFFDEIDALGKSRGDFSVNMNEEREQTLNQLLAAMDGFCSEKRIVVMAATNRYDVLDKALVRPGRFDRVIRLEVPDQDGREAILKVHTRHMNLAEDCDLGLIASLCPNFTGAELSMICNEAAIRAARDKRDELYTDDFMVALQSYKTTSKRGMKATRSGSDFMGQIFGGLN